MKKERRDLHIQYCIIPDRSDLSAKDYELMSRAIEAVERAYAPYSHFRVGAAILLENGLIIDGSNQENAAYPSGLCAERVVAFSAGSKYPDQKIVKIAVAANKTGTGICPVTPCGACRQVLLEYELKQEKNRDGFLEHQMI